jgi:hypothetical protein
MERGEIAPAYLFIGPEAYQRRRARRALLKAHAVTQYDLAETSLAEVIDDARALSLFASERVIFAGNAEAALPRTRVEEDAEEGDGRRGFGGPIVGVYEKPHARRSAGFRRSAFRFRRRR